MNQDEREEFELLYRIKEAANTLVNALDTIDVDLSPSRRYEVEDLKVKLGDYEDWLLK